MAAMNRKSKLYNLKQRRIYSTAIIALEIGAKRLKDMHFATRNISEP
jgi:hypothetical protein